MLAAVLCTAEGDLLEMCSRRLGWTRALLDMETRWGSPQELNQTGSLRSWCGVSRSTPLLPCPAPKSSMTVPGRQTHPPSHLRSWLILPPSSCPTFSSFLPKETDPNSSSGFLLPFPFGPISLQLVELFWCGSYSECSG